MVFRITGGPKKPTVDQLPGTTPKTMWQTLGVAAASALIRKLSPWLLAAKPATSAITRKLPLQGPTQDLVTFATVCKTDTVHLASLHMTQFQTLAFCSISGG